MNVISFFWKGHWQRDFEVPSALVPLLVHFTLLGDDDE